MTKRQRVLNQAALCNWLRVQQAERDELSATKLHKTGVSSLISLHLVSFLNGTAVTFPLLVKSSVLCTGVSSPIEVGAKTPIDFSSRGSELAVGARLSLQRICMWFVLVLLSLQCLKSRKIFPQVFKNKEDAEI